VVDIKKPCKVVFSLQGGLLPFFILLSRENLLSFQFLLSSDMNIMLNGDRKCGNRGIRQKDYNGKDCVFAHSVPFGCGLL
jgi:hypothetical protein